MDETLYLYTSLTAGSSHIITATSRMETILKANRVPFRAIDCATDEKARQLWSRRSKGKKLPGLVKYGQIIGDMAEVEEWNEYGELVDQIESASDLFADTPMTDTPMPAPVNTIPPNKLQPIIDVGMEKPKPQPVRQGSDTSRHISISEPAKVKKEEKNPAGSLQGQTPLAMAMRQLGAEAAAKAGQNKAAAVAAIKTKSAVPSATTASATTEDTKETATSSVPKSDPSDTTPSAAATKLSSDATLDSSSPEDKTSLTSAKTPAQLASEGVTPPVSADKAVTLPDGTTSSTKTTTDASLAATKSNEEQVLEQRRSSSIAKTHSSLAQETSVDDVSSEEDDDSSEELSAEQKAAAQAVANVEAEKKAGSKNSKATEADAVQTPGTVISRTVDVSSGANTATTPPSGVGSAASGTTSEQQRGESTTSTSKDEPKKAAAKNKIEEESEEADEEEEEDEDDDEESSEDDEGDDDDDEDEEDEEADDDNITKEVAKETKAPSAPIVTATDKSEAKVSGGAEPQKQKAAAAQEAGKSVGD